MSVGDRSRQCRGINASNADLCTQYYLYAVQVMINNNSNSVHQRILSRFIVRIRDVSCSISDKSRVRKGQIGRERERENRGMKITRNSVKKDLWFSLYNMSFGEKFIRIHEWLDEWTIVRVCVCLFVSVFVVPNAIYLQTWIHVWVGRFYRYLSVVCVCEWETMRDAVSHFHSTILLDT